LSSDTKRNPTNLGPLRAVLTHFLGGMLMLALGLGMWWLARGSSPERWWHSSSVLGARFCGLFGAVEMTRASWMMYVGSAKPRRRNSVLVALFAWLLVLVLQLTAMFMEHDEASIWNVSSETRLQVLLAGSAMWLIASSLPALLPGDAPQGLRVMWRTTRTLFLVQLALAAFRLAPERFDLVGLAIAHGPRAPMLALAWIVFTAPWVHALWSVRRTLREYVRREGLLKSAVT
jgi:hypothetical protein